MTLLAAVSLSSMIVPTADFSPGVGKFMHSVVRPCLCSDVTTLHISAPEAVFWFTSFNLLPHAFANLALNLCCLESTITGAGVNPASHISVLPGVLGNAP